MNKVITINLRGTAFQLEESGYDALRAYLETAAARLLGNPDQEEILSDIEWAIAEKFRPLLGNHKTVVVTQEVTAALAEMGPIEADPGPAPNSGAGGGGTPGGPGESGTAGEEPAAPAGGSPRRLYRMPEGAMIAGVCNGLAAYLGLDPTLVRLAFVFLAIFWGTGVVAYVIMAIVVPEARSPEEKAAASGDPSTAQEFIRRAREGYYEAIKGFPNRQARREWKRQFKREMRAHKYFWGQHWQGCWTKPAPPLSGLGLAEPFLAFILPFISVLHGIVNILWVCATVSLLTPGNVFGLALPANVPVWVAVLILFILYGLIAWPLKAARRACYWGLGRPGPAGPLILLLDAMVWLVVVATLLWLAVHYFPQLHDAVQNLPALVHQAGNDIRTWGHGK
jgi:phage shock protein PspC (stress-responsive transcriptional regulator)